jgi:hypothetical protein
MIHNQIITNIGLPYHGLIDEGILPLINGHKLAYPGITNGDTQLLSVPNSSITSSKIVNQTKGFEWRNKAIVADNHLGGINLGKDWLLYIDANRVVWYLKLGFQASGNQCTMSCTLLSVFGRFNSLYPQIFKELAQEQTHLLHPGHLKPLNRFTFERKPDGSEVFIHVYAKFDVENSIEFPEEMSLYEIWKLELKGNGQLTEDDVLGSGITATLNKYKTFAEIHTSHREKIPRVESKFRVGKVNVTYVYDPKPTEAPECNTTICRSAFDLALVPEDENFIAFNIDRNTYIQSNWYGEIETKSSIVRVLYDSNGELHNLSVQRESKRLNRLYQTFEGRGSGIQGPIQYYFNGFMCVVNGMMPGWVETYDGIQSVESQFMVRHQASVLMDGQPIQVLSLQGETNQTANTKIGQPVVNSINVNVKINDSIVRNLSGKPGEISNAVLADPFANSYQRDAKNGIYAKFHFGLISNNLLGQFITRLASSNAQNIVARESHGVVGAKIRDHDVKRHPWQFHLHGSFNPISEEIVRYQEGVQCWV